ncbi:MAG: hypothetical protein KF780_02115 [Sphingomonas sp.]|nr:hypothetical protein [Sphingomonas sp.]
MPVRIGDPVAVAGGFREDWNFDSPSDAGLWSKDTMLQLLPLLLAGGLQVNPQAIEVPRDRGPNPPTLSRLLRQRVDAGRRVCVYGLPNSSRPDMVRGQAPSPEESHGQSRSGREDQSRSDREGRPQNALRAPEVQERRVALEERCPFRDPGEDSPLVRPIPAMAIFSREAYVGNRRICYYVHLGERYARAVSPAGTCPMTPHFFN